MKENKQVFNPSLYLSGKDTQNKKWFHFSVDDVFESLIEVTDKNIKLFDHPFFLLLREVHLKYGVNIGLNLFFQKKINGKERSLKEVRSLHKEIVEDGGWLFFGPHALDYENAPYNQKPEEQICIFDLIYGEIDRIAGKDFYARWIRLHFYSESYELASYFKKRDVCALFSTDRPSGSHRMPQNIKNTLNNFGGASYEGVNFIRTQFRVEFFADENISKSDLEKKFKESFDKYGYIIFYSHEYEFKRKEVCEAFLKSFEVLDSLNIKSLQNI